MLNDEVLLDNLQSHLLTIVVDGARGGEGEEALKEGGLANFLIPHNHQFGAVEGNRWMLLQVKDVLDDLVSGLFCHFQGEGGEGGGILRKELDMRVNSIWREKW